MEAERLRGSTFSRVFDEGCSTVGRFMILHYRRRESGGLRIGFAAGKKLGGAVVRNRMRRRLREVVRSLPPACIEADVVLVARKQAGSVPFSQLREEAVTLLSRSGLLRQAGEGFDGTGVERMNDTKGSDTWCDGSSWGP